MFAMFASKNLKYGLFALVVVMAYAIFKSIACLYNDSDSGVSTAIFGVFDYNKKQSK